MAKRTDNSHGSNKKTVSANKKSRTDTLRAPLGSFLTTRHNPARSGKKGKVVLEKDEDEYDLEEAVFGRSTRARDEEGEGRGRRGGEDGAEDDEDQDGTETGLERLQDESLFFFDAPPVIASTSKASQPRGSDDENDEADQENDDDDEEIDWEAEDQQDAVKSSGEGSDSDVAPRKPITPSIVKLPRSRNLRQAVWFDPADVDLTVSLTSVARLRKLRQTKDENFVSGLEYETRLRRQFEKMHPPPAWAVEARRKVLKQKEKAAQQGASGLADDDDDEDAEVDSDAAAEEVDDLFRTTGTIKRKRTRGILASGDIDIDRVRDANQAETSGKKIVALGFHPRAQVLFSATDDRRLRLFQTDGTENPLLQTLHVPELPITTVAYHPSGSSLLMTGPRPYFVSYDLQTGQTVKRTLLTGGLGGSDRASSGGHGGMERFEFSPDGEILAVGGRRGYVHLVDWGKEGVGKGGQVFGEVKMNVAVKGIAWHKEGKELMTLGEDSEVYVWDVGTRKCITRWRDDGGFGACGLVADASSKYTAVASTTGIVNLYDSATSSLPASGQERKATKTIGNLVTSVTSMKFNHDAQILALASATNKDQLKLVHTASATVFSNWPTQQTPLHHVTAIDFSKGSEWLAVGNKRGKVLLYTLKSFI
ncbi:hypothetical protein MVLG_00283 [Microbotryum lychnidis-dioicae p1A1 Lamole]|uniref:Uncharacterized protein n=1 Tax=Microbotryum lychnidis-dioicae (strain p1A1 Lamole / MvSl-1064) TaxID=683840 RepID=U5GYL7_USTV1|nr:hypothetical protein MVLG_00283 [Microbotryum lychnidis-dioicae p1A1 Lamole]|eukprot:KDE09376.1 hypothetical protein MVLG_00283 [Microbotryum lychnidis-dioicae p1A1 Lamole]